MINLPDSLTSSIQKQPYITHTEKETSTISATFLLPDSFVGFDGHFPDNPIVPGIVQIMMAKQVAEYNQKTQLTQVKRCKFLNPIKPNDLIQVLVKVTPETATNIQCQAELSVNQTACANIHFSLKAI